MVLKAFFLLSFFFVYVPTDRLFLSFFVCVCVSAHWIFFRMFDSAEFTQIRISLYNSTMVPYMSFIQPPCSGRVITTRAKTRRMRDSTLTFHKMHTRQKPKIDQTKVQTHTHEWSTFRNPFYFWAAKIRVLICFSKSFGTG
jgi:hypothetical protein